MPAATPQVQFVNGKVLFRAGFGSADQQVAMGTDCCCDSSITRPGYGIYARLCCSGSTDLPGKIWIDLTHPPDWVWSTALKRQELVGNGQADCFYFDTGDVDADTAFLIDPDNPPDGVEFLPETLSTTNGTSYVKVDCDDRDCGCKCCFDYKNNHDDPNNGKRAGIGLTSGYGASAATIWFQFVDVQFCPRTTDCHYYGMTGAGATYVKNVGLTVPTGPYSIETIDGECNADTIPTFEYTVTYWLDSNCNTTPHPTLVDKVETMQVWPGVIKMGPEGSSTPSPACGSIDGAKVFFGGNSLGGDNESDCFTQSVWNNQFVGCECADNPAAIGYGQGYGGYCIVGTCCPDSGGI